MDRFRRVTRAVLVVTVLAASLALLPAVGLPYQPLEATVQRLSSALYDRPTKLWFPIGLRNGR
jgi:cytochrome c-type biogenesis protein CcmH/NrfG